MSDESGKPGASLREKLEFEKAQLLKQLASVAARVQDIDQKLNKLTEVEQFAAEYNFDLVPKLVAPEVNPPPTPLPVRETAIAPESVVGITIENLIDKFLTDPKSSFQSLKFQTREDAKNLYERIKRERGYIRLARIGRPELEDFYNRWSAGGTKLAIGHSLMGKLRTAITFGNIVLNDTECQRLSGIYQTLQFEAPKARAVRLTAEQANAICAVANKQGLRSIAIAQAIQFETELRQRDVIGEWVPIDEPNALSEILNTRGEKKKWLRGLRWSHIDSDLFLNYEISSTRQKTVRVDLKALPMAKRELLWVLDRSAYPASGPIIVSESSGLPYRTEDFRKKWRKIADEAGVPKTVRNMDNMRSDNADDEETESEADAAV